MSQARADSPPMAPLRSPDVVMRLARLGSLHASRLSFMRILLRRLAAETWRFTRPVFDIDARGVGRAVYTATGPDRSYSLVAFGHDLPDEQRSDRVIAEAWDATFTLFDGVPAEADLDRLSRNVPLQEAGRVAQTELCLARANRSVRLFSHVIDRLAEGRQPDADRIDAVGYLMRTTAVYGSGKFGAADREALADRPELQAPFQAEMLTVFLIRTFVRDLIEEMARRRAPDRAVPLAADLARRLGIGNSTGLGMAPFLVNHPVLLNNWIAAREMALARVRGLPVATEGQAGALKTLTDRARINARDWRSDHPLQLEKLAVLRRDLDALAVRLADDPLTGPAPWDALWRWGETALGLEGQEALAALLIEPHGDLVDDLAATMAADEGAAFRIDGSMRLRDLAAILTDVYGKALAADWQDPAATARLWYVSAEKLEPRLAERAEEPLEPYEQPLAPARDAAALSRTLAGQDPDQTVAEFLMRAPEHRGAVRRAQIAARLPYAEIRDNTIAADMLPIDMLRAKLSFFGATHFDPRSDRWVRINMYRGAPYPETLTEATADDWAYPALSAAR